MTREEAIELLKYLIPIPHRGDGKSTSHLLQTNALAMAIKALEQEPKTGHWIYDDIANNWRCDKCGETPKTMGYVGTADFMSEHFRFCNHCGARMVESQENPITIDEPDMRVTAEEAAEEIQNITKAGIIQILKEHAEWLPQYEGKWVKK